MAARVPRWVRRVLGMPGEASFARFQPVLRAARAHGEWARAADDLAQAADVCTLDPAQLTSDADGWGRLLALAVEAARRELGVAAHDEQIVAACALLGGNAVEMDTGEGKTLTGALAAAGFARAGQRVHVLCVNDYLAQRDAEWMGGVLKRLGVSVAWIGQHTQVAARREGYRADVVYAPVSEVGYDLLRDRFVERVEDRVDPALQVAIVDEADAVMIDEAMSPLVLAGTDPGAAEDSGPQAQTSAEPPSAWAQATLLVRGLDPGRDFTVDDDRATVTLTDAGLDRLERELGGINLYHQEHTPVLTRINLALHAAELVRRDVDYIVDEGGIRLINTARGRVAHRQRWPDGLHAAIEAKEQLAVSDPGVILDTLTVQDLLLRYQTLAGMSGTITTVADELIEFYRLRSGRVARHTPGTRVDLPPQTFLHREDMIRALVQQVRVRHNAGQPVLVGTQSIAESEQLAALLAGMPTRTLNARNDASEAAIIARAGEPGAITISTQMSGRGTDIRLGGADEAAREQVVAAGGLAVIACGRYPSGRLDVQLRGRAGRQADPGVSVVFASIDDELVQANAPAHLLTMARRNASRPGVLGKVVRFAQRIAEGTRTDRHRATWDYNRAITAQRAKVLHEREAVLNADASRDERTRPEAVRRMREYAPEAIARLESEAGVARVAEAARIAVLFYLDDAWLDHLAALSELRDGIHLRALAGQNPRDEFHRLALRQFHGFFADAFGAAAAFLTSLQPAELDEQISHLRARRPAATWTYMLSDNPLGTGMDRAARTLGAGWRKYVLRVE